VPVGGAGDDLGPGAVWLGEGVKFYGSAGMCITNIPVVCIPSFEDGDNGVENGQTNSSRTRLGISTWHGAAAGI